MLYFKYVFNDKFNVWLEVIEPNAVSDIRQAARLRVHRDGDLSEKFTISLRFDGTAKQGEHAEPLTDSITLETGQSFADILVNARSAGLSNGAKVLVLKLDPSEGYQLGNPSEALVYVGATAAEANNAGFDRWLAASSNRRLRCARGARAGVRAAQPGLEHQLHVARRRVGQGLRRRA